MKRKPRTSHGKRRPTYELLEPRNLLAGDILVTDLKSGVAVSDNATGTGHIMYTETSVHTRFSGVPTNNSDHFIATRLDGLQWQYNNDTNWINFTPDETDLLVAEVNYDSDTVSRLEINFAFEPSFFGGTFPTIVETVQSGFSNGDLRFAANRFGGSIDEGEFQVLGSSFSRNGYPIDLEPDNKIKLTQLRHALHRYEQATSELPRAAIVDDLGNETLSWRVQLLPFLGLQDLYDQFNLNEPWDSANNLPLASQMPDVYSSPNFNSSTDTLFVALTGSGTLFPAFGPSIDVFDDDGIPDGAHTTLLFVEADADRSVVWTQPADLEFDPTNPLDGLGNITPEGFDAVTAYGLPFKIPPNIDAQNFTNMVLRDDGNFVDFSEVETYHFAGNSLTQISQGTFEYAHRFNTFPKHAIYSSDGTTPLLSWRVAILPYIEHQDLYEQFHLDEPWDSPHNITLLPKMPYFYFHPDVGNEMTNFQAVVGPGTSFPLEDAATDWDDVYDGIGNTIMFVETDADHAVEWTRPADWSAANGPTLDGLGGFSPDDGFHVAFADGGFRFVNNSIDGNNFAKMLTIEGGEVADFSDLSPRYRAESQLSELGLGALNYESAHMTLPQHATYGFGTTPLLSWRVAILPFVGQRPLYDMFNQNEPWDSPHNLALLPLMPDIFASEGLAEGFTAFQVPTGPTTAFPEVDEGTIHQSITDGLGNTAMFVQVNSDRAVEWTRPADLSFNPSNPDSGLGNAEAGGFHFATVDSGVHFYNNALDREPLEFLMQIDDGVSFVQEHVEDLSQLYWPLQTRFNLRKLAIAALDFESATMRFPSHAIYSPPTSSGTPTLSWRVQLLPFLDEQALYYMFRLDEPWDSPHNLSLLPMMPDVFAHPLVEPGKTVFQAVTSQYNSSESTMIPIHYRGYNFGAVSDGSSNTALFVEANIDQAVEWTKPDDVAFDPSDPTFGLGEAYYQIGNHFAMTDGSVNFYRGCVSDEFIGSLLMKSDGNVIDPENTECNSAPATVVGAGLAYGDLEATDKTPLLPGETATFENYSSYVNGITALSVDIGRLADPNSISASDFTFRVGNGSNFSDFTTISLTPTVTVDPTGGDNESARVTLEFPAGFITNTWLQVTVLATDNTGLDSSNVFYFGNAIGETGDNPNSAVVNLIDVARARVNQSGLSTVDADNAFDINRDGRVNLIDVALIRTNQSGFSPLNLITAPGSSNRSGDVAFDSRSNGSVASLGTFSTTGSFAVSIEKEQAIQNQNSQRGFLPAEGSYLSGAVERGTVERILESEYKSNDQDLFEPLDPFEFLDQLNDKDLIDV